MAESKIQKPIKYEVYIKVKRGTAGLMPANDGGTFAASAIGVQPDQITGYTLMGTLLESTKPGCVVNYSENGSVNWQNITSTAQDDVVVIATYFYLKKV